MYAEDIAGIAEDAAIMAIGFRIQQAVRATRFIKALHRAQPAAMRIVMDVSSTVYASLHRDVARMVKDVCTRDMDVATA